MTSLAILIPVKSSGVKSRLSGLVSADQRREFAVLMLNDVLGIIRRAGLIDDCYVVSSDNRILTQGTRLGAQSIKEPGDRGVNSAVIRGIKETGGPDTVLVIPSDLPLLKASELRHLLAVKSSGVDVVMAPSKGFDGTNALAFSGASDFRLSYDSDSFWNHLAGAASDGASVCVCTEPGLMFDVDSFEDFRALARRHENSPSVRFAKRTLR